MKFPKNQSGFGVVEVILVLAVIGLIGVVGWLVYDRQDSSTTNNQALSASEDIEPSQSSTTTATTASTAQNTQEYLEVKEWGLKVKMRDADKVTYTYDGSPGSSYGGYESSISFKIKPEHLRDKNCKLELGMFRTSQVPGFTHRKIGDKYYFITGSPYGCVNSDGSENTVDNNLKKTIQEQLSLDNIEA